MNRAYLVIVIPAIVVAFFWTSFIWGLRAAVCALAVELGVIAAVAGYIKRRTSATSGRT